MSDPLRSVRDEWLRRVREAADGDILDRLRYDGQPLGPVAREALRVLAGRLTWASVHWGAVHPDALVALAVALERGGWAPPREAPKYPGVQWVCPRCRRESLIVGDLGPLGTIRCTCGHVGPAAGPGPAAEPRTIPSRRTDPGTSHDAEPAPVRADTQRHKLLAAFGLPAAAGGLTDEEAADLADGVPYRSEFAKRCSELRAAGLLEVVDGVTRRGVAGHQRIVSRITDAGRTVLATLERTT